MSSFSDREGKRTGRSVAASMISTQPEPEAPGRGRPKADRETKKRVCLAVFPSVYDAIQKIAYVKRKSISEIVAECLENYVAEHEEELKRYDEIVR